MKVLCQERINYINSGLPISTPQVTGIGEDSDF